MTHILLIDSARGASELFVAALNDQLGARVTYVSALAEVTPDFARHGAFDLALVDLSFPAQQPLNGGDALLVLQENAPATALGILTQGDPSVHELLRDAWEVFELAAVVSKAASLREQMQSIARALAGERPVVDPELRMLVPERRSPWRTLDSFARLVPHAGHAKVWKALIESPVSPSYGELAMITGLAPNSLRNYRTQIVPELRLHGIDEPSLREMHAFARRCRPFLAPYVNRRLAR